jgi:hypothetical protein
VIFSYGEFSPLGDKKKVWNCWVLFSVHSKKKCNNNWEKKTFQTTKLRKIKNKKNKNTLAITTSDFKLNFFFFGCCIIGYSSKEGFRIN